jgi:DNA-binding response OmpR family regulator
MYVAIALPGGLGSAFALYENVQNLCFISIGALPACRGRVRVHTATFAGHRVLVAEREFHIAWHVTRILEDEGATAFRASSVAQALRIVDNGTLSAGVLETRLGSEDCEPVCRALAQRNVPFIFHTSHVRQPMIQFPGVLLIGKPASAAEIVGALKNVLFGKRDILNGERNDSNIAKFLASI